MSLENVYQKKWVERDLARQMDQELQTRGEISNETRYAQALFRETLNPDYKVAPPIKRDIKPTRVTPLRNLELNDYYAHPVDMHQNTLGWVANNHIYFKNKSLTIDAPFSFTHLIFFDGGRKAIIGEKEVNFCPVDLEHLQVGQPFDLNHVKTVAVDENRYHFGGDEKYSIHDPRSAITCNYPDIKQVIKILPRGQELLLGTNQNTVLLYDQRNMDKPVSTYEEHAAGVRALHWLSTKKFISGGGTQDKTLKIWDKTRTQSVQTIATDGQVLDIHEDHGLLYSVHGFVNNECNIWKISDVGLRKVGQIQLDETPEYRPLFSQISNGHLYIAQPSQEETLLSDYPIAAEKQVDSLADRFSKFSIK